ncbi:MAG: GNAT family N-acetyltransferase [Rhodothermaceae bacterium]|nr:GNAT family N-acetyltransferase [Rhodothermaceae bacterium]
MNIRFRPYRPDDSPVLERYISDLYAGDISGKPMTADKIRNTIAMLTARPDLGSILMIENGEDVVGYAILINFWSNEYGGIMLNIDELYIAPGHRGKGFASALISHLAQSRYNNAVALQLEVSPKNHAARRLYNSLGFTPHPNHVLTLEL